MRNRNPLLVALATFALAACGDSDDGDDGGSGVDGAKAVNQLSASETTQLCTWGLAQLGGAGAQENCGDNVIAMNATVAQCEEDLSQFTCAITVAEIEACLVVCDSPCDIQIAPECATVRDCLAGV